MGKRWVRTWAGGVVRGFLMGGADVVPGVSGGTVALILGIYERLVTALSRFDGQLAAEVRRGRWAAAARRVDLAFLASLGVGIGLGIVSLGGLMNHLLSTPATRGVTLAAFFGMIVASSWLVARRIPWRGWRGAGSAACWLGGALAAYWLTGLPPSSASLAWSYLFLCGAVAICAMILPGVSGAYVLLILGAYVPLTDVLKRLPRGDVGWSDAAVVAVFGAGCAVGLWAFSKVLRWLLARWRGPTLAVLCGFMCGALRKIWPFQRDMTPELHDLKAKVFVNVWPERFDGRTAACLAAAVLALLVVLAGHWAAEALGGGERSEAPAASE